MNLEFEGLLVAGTLSIVDKCSPRFQRGKYQVVIEMES